MEEVLVRHLNITEATTNFHNCDKDQRYDERTDIYVTKLRDAAISCNYIIECECSCKKETVVDFSDRMN